MIVFIINVVFCSIVVAVHLDRRVRERERVGDITLADFWKYQADEFYKRGIEKGVNLVIVNTKKGNMFFNEIQRNIFCESRTWEDAISSNKSFIEPWKKPKKSDEFWKDYFEYDFSKLIEKYCVPASKEEFTAWRRAWINAHKYMVPDWVIKKLRKIKSRIK